MEGKNRSIIELFSKYAINKLTNSAFADGLESRKKVTYGSKFQSVIFFFLLVYFSHQSHAVFHIVDCSLKSCVLERFM